MNESVYTASTTMCTLKELGEKQCGDDDDESQRERERERVDRKPIPQLKAHNRASQWMVGGWQAIGAWAEVIRRVE
jgi:hypothetical protein